MTRTGWDMDPFVVISFGKKVFRTRVIRHSLNPNWDEKLLFHVRRYESNFNIQLGVLDWDKLSSNDHVGDATVSVAELVKKEKISVRPCCSDTSWAQMLTPTPAAEHRPRAASAERACHPSQGAPSAIGRETARLLT